jgi:hypothetical protein
MTILLDLFPLFLLQSDGERGFAICGGIVECLAAAIAFAGFEVHAALDAVGKAGEAGFAVGVSAKFEIEAVKASEAVSDVNLDFCSIDGSAIRIGDGEISGAWTGAAVDHRHGFGI